MKVAFEELQLQLVVADGEIPVEEQHALDSTPPVRTQRLSFLLVPVSEQTFRPFDRFGCNRDRKFPVPTGER